MLDLLKAKRKRGEIDLTQDRDRRGSFTDLRKRHIQYTMHGGGCLFIINEQINVDIDFAGPRYDGIDFYFLLAYFSSCPEKYPEVKDEDQLRECLNELIANEYLVKEDRNKYYLKSEFDHPKEFEW